MPVHHSTEMQGARTGKITQNRQESDRADAPRAQKGQTKLMGASCQHEQRTGSRKIGIPTRCGLEKRLLQSQYKICSHGAREGRSCAEKTSDHTWGYGGVAARSSSSKAAPHDEQEPSEDLPGNRVPKVNLIKSPKWPIKSRLKGVHRHHPRALLRGGPIDRFAQEHVYNVAHPRVPIAKL
jgi:hypothetical protein